MLITKITNQHLINRIAFFERMLADNPGEQFYMGESEYAEDAVEQENRHNETLSKKIKGHIAYMKSELRKRK